MIIARRNYNLDPRDDVSRRFLNEIGMHAVLRLNSTRAMLPQIINHRERIFGLAEGFRMIDREYGDRALVLAFAVTREIDRGSLEYLARKPWNRLPPIFDRRIPSMVSEEQETGFLAGIWKRS